ncbi:hypothetical protein PDIG_18100 [Penicillium digitatum PHI26]|uniref:Uncharacterized protein n=2 Tax=Penicillium digitatum TaxID=36651 RepID=K9G671_PEND2|nr:hypothetical protein PDIP_55950 [Penicillium digitatum Pd1]EKV11555.1 hypothetical protein PDIP_55950 [Penicillium digitatum Pd1]EKV16894.1 hypothetical protein PDIG_18100 [Penicillium digitatum PHI26]
MRSNRKQEKRKARRRGSSSARIAQRAATPACQLPEVGLSGSQEVRDRCKIARLTNWGGRMNERLPDIIPMKGLISRRLDASQ